MTTKPVRSRRHPNEVSDARDTVRDELDAVASGRDRISDERDAAGEGRDETAAGRDARGDQRDRIAERRSLATERSDVCDALYDVGPILRAGAADRKQSADDRRAAAAERTLSKGDRDSALADRSASALERGEASSDRNTALANRRASATDLEVASVDSLTGAYLRGPGLIELKREIARAQRTEQSLVLAFVDVNGLKVINDSGGHAAGDRMLRKIASTLRMELRSYDLLVRYGGDEFLCALPGANLAIAAKRFSGVNAVLSMGAEPVSVTAGLAKFEHDDSCEILIARADVALYRMREAR